MSFITSLRNFFGRSSADRVAALHNRWRMSLSFLAFVFLGRWVNRPGSALLVVARPDFDYDKGGFAEFEILHRLWNAGVEINNGADLIRLFLICQNARQICREGIVGDFVEIGVYKGNSAAVLHHYARDAGRRLFLFDTFSGFDSSDFRGIDASVKHAGFRDTSLERVKKFVGTDGVIYVPGLFPNSLEGIEDIPESVALLHIDCDLYAPMRSALEFFYPRMCKGGLMLLHDYGSSHWPGITKAVDEFFSDKVESVIVMPDKSGTAAIRRM